MIIKPVRKLMLPVLALGLLAMAACSGGDKGPSPEEARQQYISSVTEIKDEIAANEEAALEINFQDSEQAEEYIESSKAMYERLKALEAPEELAEIKAKLDEGAGKMLEYFERLPEYLDAEGGDETLRNELIAVYSQGLTAIAEGYSQVDQLPAPADADGGDQ